MKTWYNLAMMATMITLMIISPFFFHCGENAFCATPAEIQEWLDAHNKYRSLHGVPPVTWSATVAASAQAWADTCPSGHSSSGYGENMAFAGYVMSPTDVVGLWYSEEHLYPYGEPAWNPAWGHFTQVVWKSTTQIGCGYRTGCSGSWPNVWVCQYNPPGNYIGQFAANVFPPVVPEYTWSSMTSGTTVILDEVWGSSGSNVFAVGRYGNILRYNGGSWASMTKVNNQDLFGVWGSSASNVFAVGWSGTILHYNGSSWTSMTSPTSNWIEGVWGSSGTNVFAVGGYGTILRYNGSSWSSMTSPTTNSLYSVWGSSSSNVFAVGYNGTILRYNGSTWSAMSSGTTSFLYHVWGSSGSDVFAVGSDGTILHYNGSSWSSMTSPTTSSLYGLWGSSGSDVFAVGRDGKILHYNGSFWSFMTSPTTKWLEGVWGSSGSDVFAVGFDGTILHYGPGPSCPPCSGGAVVLTNVTFPSGTTCECVGTTSITIGAGVTVQTGATVTFKAPIVHVNPGFHAENGSTVSIKQQ